MTRHANPAAILGALDAARTTGTGAAPASGEREAHRLQAQPPTMSATGRHSFTTGMVREARRALEGRRTSLQARPPTPESECELLELEAALARIDAGTWGRCERCGGAIGRDRLRALPETRVCLPCAKLPGP